MKRILIIGGIIAALGAVLIAGLFLGLMVSPARAQINHAIGQVIQGAQANLPLPQSIAAQAQTQTPANPQLQLKDEKGVLVAGVFVNSPADKAGIARGDIITSIDGQAVNTYADLKTVLSSHKAGDALQVQVQHGDAQKTLSVTLAESPYQTTTQNSTPNSGAQGQTQQTPVPNQPKRSQLATLPFLGIVPSDEGRGEKGFGFFGNNNGQGPSTQAIPGAHIMQVATGSPAEKAGLKVGDVIVSVDGTAINAQNSLQALLANHKPGDSVKLSVGTIDTTSGTVTNQHDVTVTLGDNPNAQGKAYLGVSVAAGGRGGRFRGFPGMPGNNGGQNGAPNGVNPGTVQHPGAVIDQVTAGSPADKAGLKAGQYISAVDGKTLTNPQDLVTAISNHKPGDTVTLTVFNQGNTTTSTDVKVTLGANPQNASAAWLGIQFSFISIQPGQQPGSPTQSLPQG